MRRSKNTRRRAYLDLEIAISLVLLGVLAVTLAKAIGTYNDARRQSLAARSALWAADAQLQRIRAGAPADSRPPENLVPKTIELKTKVELGRGEWEGFNRVTVMATIALPRNRHAQEQIVGYIRAGGGS